MVSTAEKPGTFLQVAPELAGAREVVPRGNGVRHLQHGHGVRRHGGPGVGGLGGALAQADQPPGNGRHNGKQEGGNGNAAHAKAKGAARGARSRAEAGMLSHKAMCIRGCAARDLAGDYSSVKEVRWCGEGPWRAIAARWSAVG